MSHKKIILALDVPSLYEAQSLASSVAGEIGMIKIGLELFMSAGPESLKIGKEVGCEVFLDLKLHDIPETVERAAARAVDMGVKFFTIHMQQRDTLERVVERTEGTNTTALMVSVLTSIKESDLSFLNVYNPYTINYRVAQLASAAYNAGIRGFILSSLDLAGFKGVYKDTVAVVPGIRPAGSASGDQVRIGTPGQAIKDGADYLVIGRPIRDAVDKVAAVRSIVNEINSVV